MPLLNDQSTEADWVEPDEVPRPLVTYGFASKTFGNFELALHQHAKSQILFVRRGALTCEVDQGLWIVPPQSAIWIPGGTRHALKVAGALEGYVAFIAPDVDVTLSAICCTVAVTPLMRELLVRAAHLSFLYEEGGANARLVNVLFDELAAALPEDLHLPMPSDERLKRIVEKMLASPADRGTLQGWAEKAGMSTRTFERLIRRETGISFGRWRQQLGIILAVRWLAGGASIQQIAADLGYESVPSFITMFRKVLGSAPGRYMTERYPGRV